MHSENDAAGVGGAQLALRTPAIVHVKREPDAQRYTAPGCRCLFNRVIRAQREEE